MTTTNRERSVVLRALVFAAILAATVLMPGRILHAEGPVVSDETMLVEVPVVWAPGEADLYLPFEAPAAGSRTPGSVITANYQDTWPANAQAALEAAIVILENMIVTDIPIVIEAHWEPVAGNTLGFGGPYLRSFTGGVPFINTWMPAVLVNELVGSDQFGVSQNNPIGAELKLTMNSNWGSWHYGPGPAPAGKVDFTSVALHELIHGLGFTGSMDPVTSTTAKWGISAIVSQQTVWRPTIYDQFTHRGSDGTKLIDIVAPNTASSALMTALRGQSGGVRFTGPNATAANGGVGALLYTPSTFVDGSSYSHLAESYNGGPNTLMTYSFQANETVHEPGPVTRGILKDFGYTLQDPPPTPGTLQFGTYENVIQEGGSDRIIQVTRLGGVDGEIAASCDTAGGTAGKDIDYQWRDTELLWADGDAAPKYCSFIVFNDFVVDPDETVIVGLENVTGTTVGTPSTATLTIKDLSPSQLTMFPPPGNGVEGIPLANQPEVQIRDSYDVITGSNATVTLELIPPPGVQAVNASANSFGRKPLVGKDSLLPEIALHGVPTDDWAVWVAPGSDAVALATALNATYISALTSFPGVHVFRFNGTAQLRHPAAVAALESSAEVLQYEQQLIMPRVARSLPSDPGVASQWHVKNTGQGGRLAGTDLNVEPAWDAGTSGAGVVIGIVDDSLQGTHPDLAANFNAALSYDYLPDVPNSGFPTDGVPGPDPDPSPSSSDDHGTAVAGLAAAAANNGVCGAGIAYGASLAGIRGGGYPVYDAVEALLVAHLPQAIHVYNNSWGPPDDGSTLGAIGTLSLASIKSAIANGRGGLGNIFVWAGGNGRLNDDNSNFDGYANLREVIAVAAVDGDGEYAAYSEPGANILVATPGGTLGGDIYTTDRAGSSGYSNGDCTTSFNGTSAAAPIAAGAVALILEANPNLTWRDVQHILVQTAKVVDPSDSDWSMNGAGYDINHNYGFGMIDAAAAVELARSWTNVRPEESASSGLQYVLQEIPDGNLTGLSRQVVMSGDLEVEHVELVFSASHAWRGDLEVTLTSPAGTVSKLSTVRPFDADDNFVGWRFTSTRHWGEDMEGTWTITVRDVDRLIIGSWTGFELNFYGTGDLNTVPELTCDGGLSRPASNGVARFTGCKVSQPGAGYKIRATVEGLPPVESAPFDITSTGLDATCNGSVEADDVLAVLRSLAGFEGDIVFPCTGRASGGPQLSLADAILIRRAVAGLP